MSSTFQQLDRAASGEGTQRVGLADVARIGKGHFQHSRSSRMLHGHDERNPAVGRLTLDGAVPAAAGCIDNGGEFLKPSAASVTFAHHRGFGQTARNLDHHRAHSRSPAASIRSACVWVWHDELR